MLLIVTNRNYNIPQVYSGAGTISTVGTYTASTADAAIQSVSFTAEASASGVVSLKSMSGGICECIRITNR